MFNITSSNESISVATSLVLHKMGHYEGDVSQTWTPELNAAYLKVCAETNHPRDPFQTSIPSPFDLAPAISREANTFSDEESFEFNFYCNADYTVVHVEDDSDDDVEEHDEGAAE